MLFELPPLPLLFVKVNGEGFRLTEHKLKHEKKNINMQPRLPLLQR